MLGEIKSALSKVHLKYVLPINFSLPSSGGCNEHSNSRTKSVEVEL